MRHPRLVHLSLTAGCVLLILPALLIDSATIRTVFVAAVTIPYFAASVYLDRRARAAKP